DAVGWGRVEEEQASIALTHGRRIAGGKNDLVRVQPDPNALLVDRDHFSAGGLRLAIHGGVPKRNRLGHGA
ncbi:MAG: hypothetical protein PHW86_07340, partial [Candidatus Bipolaricaulis sp.]|nr:hypothetical protein [Candidatus Bipolaricaulis sp.]